jgi:hypothetical protein
MYAGANEAQHGDLDSDGAVVCTQVCNQNYTKPMTTQRGRADKVTGMAEGGMLG